MGRSMSQDNRKLGQYRRNRQSIVQTQAEIRASGGEVVYDPSDREPFEILARIERKIKAKGIKQGS